TTQPYTLSLYDALPISSREQIAGDAGADDVPHADQLRARLDPHLGALVGADHLAGVFLPQLQRRHEELVDERDPERLEHRLGVRSEEHTSELQSRFDIV